jgi:hypothetical protein
MDRFVLALIGLAGTMGIKTFAAAVAADATSAVTGMLHPRAKMTVKRPHVC